ncbi:MAG: cation:dicarboxylate symporter family transporter [Dorea sp.]
MFLLGQIIFMPGVAIQFFIVSLCTGQSFGTEITIVWIITSIITCTILAIATPPIPGGGLSCYTILFAQLGIPSAGIALVISKSSCLWMHF